MFLYKTYNVFQPKHATRQNSRLKIITKFIYMRERNQVSTEY